MTAKLGVLIIHGVGGDREKLLDNMKNMERELKRKIKACGADPGQICWQRVEWDHILKNDEDEVYNSFSKVEQPFTWLIWFKLRKFVMSYIADATAYRQVPDSSRQTGKANNTYDSIHEVIHNAITKLRTELGDDDKPVIVIAHSMGSVIMSYYIWDRQNKYQPEKYGETKFERMETLAGFITFGSPMPLFALASKPRTAIEYPPKALPEYLKKKDEKGKDKVKWLNFYDPADVIAWPLKKGLGDSYEAAVTEDRKIHVGWTPLCHLSYWTHKNFTKPVAKYISNILKACP